MFQSKLVKHEVNKCSEIHVYTVFGYITPLSASLVLARINALQVEEGEEERSGTIFLLFYSTYMYASWLYDLNEAGAC